MGCVNCSVDLPSDLAVLKSAEPFKRHHNVQLARAIRRSEPQLSVWDGNKRGLLPLARASLGGWDGVKIQLTVGAS